VIGNPLRLRAKIWGSVTNKLRVRQGHNGELIRWVGEGVCAFIKPGKTKQVPLQGGNIFATFFKVV